MLLRTFSVALLAALAISPGVALASGDDVLIDCVNNTMKASYPLADYDAALQEIPADADEYGPCRDVIIAARNRQLAAASARTATAARTVRPTDLAAALGQTSPAAADAATAKAPADAVAITRGNTTPAATTPSPTTPDSTTTDGASSPTAAIIIPVPNDDDPSAGTGSGLPLVPVVLALSIIALSAARALHVWARRPERLSGEAPDAA